MDYSFKPGWAASLAVVVLLPTFVALGNWQLRRAAEKEALLALLDERSRAPEIALTADELAPAEVRYRPVVVRGTYDIAHQFLLDNQVHAGRAGYQVLTPLRFEGQPGLAILVNRGWVAMGADRTQLPDVSLATAAARVHGIAEKFPEVAWKLAGGEIPTAGWPAVVQRLEPAALAARLGYPVVAYQVLLAPAEPQGLVRDWQPAHVDPGKNRGYALQWFSFAGVLLALYGWYGLRRQERSVPPAATQ